MIAIVERHPDLRVGAGIEQSGLTRILANRVGDSIRRDAGVDLVPRFAAIMRPVEVWRNLVETQGVRGRVRDERIVMSGFDVEDPRPRLDRGWGDVGPRRAAVARHLNVAVVGTGPEDRERPRAGAQGSDAAHWRGLHGARVFAGVGGHFPYLARQIRGNPRPPMTVIDALPDDVRRV